MIIQIAHINIDLKLIYESQFKTLENYQIQQNAEYKVQSFEEILTFPFGTLQRTTEYYDFYVMDNVFYQVQKNKDQILGVIKFNQKEISLYIYQGGFQTEYLLSQYALVYILKQNGMSLFIHGSSIIYKDNGILFCAKSGTGKSTQARLWRKYTDAISLNDDKNIVLYENEKLVLYPNPWSGKHFINTNVTAELKCIVFLYQSKTNEVKKISSMEALRLLLGQIDRPDKKSLELWNQIVDAILELPLYSYGCTMEEDAVTTLKSRLEMDLCL